MVKAVLHRQFDVFRNPDSETNETHPFLIVLQSDAISEVDTRVVAPLVSPRTIKFFERLLPLVTVHGDQYVIAVPDMVAIPVSEIGPPVANLETERYRISSAIDLVFTGI